MLSLLKLDVALLLHPTDVTFITSGFDHAWKPNKNTCYFVLTCDLIMLSTIDYIYIYIEMSLLYYNIYLHCKYVCMYVSVCIYNYYIH